MFKILYKVFVNPKRSKSTILSTLFFYGDKYNGFFKYVTDYLRILCVSS